MKKIISTTLSVAMMLSMAITPIKAEETYNNKAGSWKFDFGAMENVETGYIGVDHNTHFTDELTYGFIGTKDEDYKLASSEYMDSFRIVKGQKIELTSGTRTGDGANSDFVATTDERQPIRFTMAAENGGYYNVKVVLTNSSSTEVAKVSLFTERKHQLLTDVKIQPNETLEYEFNVDVETYFSKNLNGSYKDDTISVIVSGKNAAIASMEVQKKDTNGPTIWVQTDSTGCDQPTNYPYYILNSLAGVGQGLTKYLPVDIAMSNQGDGGLSSTNTSHYAFAKAGFKAGDYFYIQYGHNETSAENYKSNLERYYNDCHAAGVRMIVVGTIDRAQTKQFDATTGKWTPSLKPYVDAGRAFVDEKIEAGATDIAFVDINSGWVEFLNDTTAYVQSVRNKMALEENPQATPVPYEANSVYYYYRYKPSGMDTTHINDAGADQAAYLFFQDAQKTVLEGTNKISVNSDEDTEATLYSVSYNEDNSLKSVDMKGISLSKGQNMIDVSEYDVDNSVMVWDKDMKPLMNKHEIQEVDHNTQVQANVLSDLVNGVRKNTPYFVPEEVIRAGKVPNSYYPEAIIEEYDGYESSIKKVNFDEDILSNVIVDFKYYIGFEQKNVPYAVAVAELYNEDGTISETYTSTSGTKYDVTNGNGTFQLNFDNVNAKLPKDGTYRVWIQGFAEDNTLMVGEEYRFSEYYTQDDVTNIEEYLIGNYDNIEIPDTFYYFGVKSGSDLNGNNGWGVVGSASKSVTLETEIIDGEKVGYASLQKTSEKNGSYVVYRPFAKAVSDGKITIETELYYTGGYARFNLSNKTSSPHSTLASSIDCFYIDTDGYLYDTDKNQLGAMPSDEWVNVQYEFDMDKGTQKLMVNGDEYNYINKGTTAMLPEQVSPSSLQQFNIMGATNSPMDIRLKNTSIKKLRQDELPEKTLTLTEVDVSQGKVVINNHDSLTKTATMNSNIVISAIAEDGYKFEGWYDENNKLISSNTNVTIRLHDDCTLEAKFELDDDPIVYAYKENGSKLTTETLAANGWVSSSEQTKVTVETDSERGNYVYFAPSNARNMQVTFPEATQLNEKYILEMDFGITSGNSDMSEFAILSTDTVVENNKFISGGYIFKMESTAKSASNSKSMNWIVNGDAENTITLEQSGTSPVWAHLKMIVDPEIGEVDVLITQGENEVYSKTLNTKSTTNLLKGFNIRAGKSYSKNQFDNILVYTASQLDEIE